ncbi:MAG: pyruvate formate lyase family protein [Thermodesulfobacteriota bacterium]|nr:pyruvate formate lyase family protein [Thermodesulfobacteriota bacterium]
MESTVNTRTLDLKERVCLKTFTDGAQAKGKTRKGVKLCIERARLITESFKETEGESMVIRRAKALARILDKMTIYIQNGERIVGNFAGDPQSVSWYPEIQYKWLDKALEDGYRDILDERQKVELKGIHAYWEGKTVEDRERAVMPVHLKRYRGFTGASLWSHYGFISGQVKVDYQEIFQEGLNGHIRRAKEKIRSLENDPHIAPIVYVQQKNFMEAVIICLEAAKRFAARYSEEALDLASTVDDPQRIQELKEIAETCKWVPGNPPRTLQEALQSFWFIHMINCMIEAPNGGCGLRFDKVMYPYYKKDMEEGRLHSKEDAKELIELLWIKFEELGRILTPQAAAVQTGGTMFQTVNLGGIDENGTAVINDLSYLALEASKTIRTLQPTLAVKYTNHLPKDFIYSAIDLLKTGIGYPSFFNDNTIIQHLLSKGIPIGSARDWSCPGCVNFGVYEGIHEPSIAARQANIGHIVLPKCLELALNQGVDKLTGEEIGYPTSDPTTFTSITDVMEAYLKQVSFFAGKMIKIENIRQAIFEEHYPKPFSAALRRDFDRIELGNGNKPSPHFSVLAYLVALGPTTVADSLAAMKKLVFEEKRITMKELLKALKNNFEGQEEIRRILINEAPKFGNDNDYVDSIAKWVHYETNRVVEKYPDYFGAPVHLDGGGTSTNITFAHLTGATPDGRRDGEPFADAILSPSAGKDKKGPTATLKSASKVDPITTYNHLFNQKFLPQFLEGDNVQLFAGYLKTWADLGIQHIQFNVVDGNTLVKAQEHPEEHGDLIVRVAGYSAYFVDLPKAFQDNIIERTEQAFC